MKTKESGCLRTGLTQEKFCHAEASDGFIKVPEEGRRSIQACFIRLMHRYTSVNYKRFLGIGIHPGQLAFVKAISEHEGISQRELTCEGTYGRSGCQAAGEGRDYLSQTGSEGSADQPVVSE